MIIQIIFLFKYFLKILILFSFLNKIVFKYIHYSEQKCHKKKKKTIYFDEFNYHFQKRLKNKYITIYRYIKLILYYKLKNVRSNVFSQLTFLQITKNFSIKPTIFVILLYNFQLFWLLRINFLYLQFFIINYQDNFDFFQI